MTRLVFDKNNTTFFVAICKSDVHSFLTFGAHNKVKKENCLLARFGKQADLAVAGDSLVVDCAKMLVNQVDAQLVSELIIRADLNDKYFSQKEKINYKAFEIDLEHYRSFLAMLSKSKLFTRTNGLCAYQVSHEDAASVEFKFKKLSDTNEYRKIKLKDEVSLDQRIGAKNISIGHTCRHTALLLLEMVFGGRFYDIDVIKHYSSFSKNFPYQSHFVKIYSQKDNARNLIKVEVDSDFIIFPTPPMPCKGKKDQIGFILCALYRQLNLVSKRYLDNEITYKKFDAIKLLYKTINDLRSESLVKVHQAIDQWTLDNAALIDQKRGFSFFSTTSTRALINSFQHIKEIEIKKSAGVV